MQAKVSKRLYRYILFSAVLTALSILLFGYYKICKAETNDGVITPQPIAQSYIAFTVYLDSNNDGVLNDGTPVAEAKVTVGRNVTCNDLDSPATDKEVYTASETGFVFLQNLSPGDCVGVKVSDFKDENKKAWDYTFQAPPSDEALIEKVLFNPFVLYFGVVRQ